MPQIEKKLRHQRPETNQANQHQTPKVQLSGLSGIVIHSAQRGHRESFGKPAFLGCGVENFKT
jgi:hypothetical protein